jgi:hypothetical protein
MHSTQSVFIIKPGMSIRANEMLERRTVVGELLLLLVLHAAAPILKKIDKTVLFNLKKSIANTKEE